ncbi:MAG: STAS domain-containing protein, partial [Myxococcota bacterium]
MSTSETNRIPIIRMWNQIVVSLQGDITDSQARHLMEDTLEEIFKSRVDGLILDLTGVSLMDSHLCATLSRLAQAAQLMGTQTVISGLSPESAMTLQAMGIELGTATALTLEAALERFGIGRHDQEDDSDVDYDSLLTTLRDT